MCCVLGRLRAGAPYVLSPFVLSRLCVEPAYVLRRAMDEAALYMRRRLYMAHWYEAALYRGAHYI
jgi:hypothetical protein